MLLTFGLPLAFLAFYLYSVSQQQPLSEAAREVQFWIPIALMAVMIVVQIMFGLIGLIITVVLLVAYAKLQRRF